MAEKTLTDLRKSLTVIESVVNQVAGVGAKRLAELFAPVLEEGEEPPDWELMLRLMQRLLERKWQELATADHEWESQSVRERLRRKERDAAQHAVHDRMLRLKRTSKGLLEDEAGLVLKLKGKLSWDWETVAREGRYVLLELRQIEEPLVSRDRVFDPAVWREPLADEVEALEQANEETMLAKKALESFSARRNATLENYGSLFVRLAAALEAFCRLVGLEEAARVARPSRKYPGRTLVEIRQLGKAPTKKSRKRSAARKKKSAAEKSGGNEPS